MFFLFQSQKTIGIVYIYLRELHLKTFFDNRIKINCKIEKRTGDVSYTLKKKQLLKIPDIILTTPESLTLTIANSDASLLLEDADYIIIDELSEFINSKRAEALITYLNNNGIGCGALNLLGYEEEDD